MRAKRSQRAPRPLGLVIAAFVLLAPVTASAGSLPAGSFFDLVAVWLQGQTGGLAWLTTSHAAGPGQVDSALVETPEPTEPEPASCGEQGSTKFDLGEQGSTKFELGEQGSTKFGEQGST